LPSLDGTASDFLVPDAASSRAALRGARAANIGSKGQLHGAYEQEIGLECRKNDVASCSASVVQMSKCYLLLVLVLATACGRTDSAPIDADDHQTCLGYGFTPGTDGFVACKMRLQRSR
jgi:hypothetical protein